MLSAEQLFDQTELGEIRKILMARHETVAVAESVTSGLVQAAFGSTPDSSSFYQGGITAYNLGQKCRHLLVEPIHAGDVNCVSEKVAATMAEQVCHMFSSHWGLGITGYAAPVPESGNKLFAYYSVAYKGKHLVIKKIEAVRQDPFQLQLLYTKYLLIEFLSLLKMQHHVV